jgi:hypothetical protein
MAYPGQTQTQTTLGQLCAALLDSYILPSYTASDVRVQYCTWGLVVVAGDMIRECSLPVYCPYEPPTGIGNGWDECFITCYERLAAELAVHWCMMGEWVEGMGEMVGAAAAATDRHRGLQRLQLQKSWVGHHIRRGACAGHLWGHFLFQTKWEGL